jgi:hypothetical protein
MKTIIEVRSTGLKGRTIQHKLQPVNVILGESFSGKTAILDAVRIGLLSYHPKLGKRAIDTFKLCKGKKMIIGLDFIDQIVEQVWQLEHGTVKYGNCGAVTIPPVLLDCREYFGMSGPQRMRYVFDQIDLKAAGFTDERVTAALRSIRPEESTEETEMVINECLETAAALVKERDEQDATIQQWVEAVVNDMKEKKKLADGAVKQMTSLMQGSTQLRAQAGTERARNVEPELKATRDKIQALQVERGKIEVQVANVRNFGVRIKSLKQSLERSEDLADDKKRLEALLVKMNKQIAGWQSKAPETARQLAEAQAEYRGAHENGQRLTVELEELEAEHKERMKQSKCPYCKSASAGWKKNIVKEFDTRRKELHSELAATELNAKNLFKQVALYRTADEAAHKEAAEMQSSMVLLRETDAELARVASSIQQRKSWMEELKNLEAQNPAAPPFNRIEAIEKELFSLEGQLSELDREQKRHVSAKANELQELRAKKQAAEQKARVTVLKLALEELSELQQTMIDVAIKNLMATANLFTRCILKQPLDYRDGDIGYVEAGQWVSHECFSGTEEALAYAGLSVALAQSAPLKLVIIDELGIIDPPSLRRRIVDRMQELVTAGVIGQFIGADGSAAAAVYEGVNLIWAT